MLISEIETLLLSLLKKKPEQPNLKNAMSIINTIKAQSSSPDFLLDESQEFEILSSINTLFLEYTGTFSYKELEQLATLWIPQSSPLETINVLLSVAANWSFTRFCLAKSLLQAEIHSIVEILAELEIGENAQDTLDLCAWLKEAQYPYTGNNKKIYKSLLKYSNHSVASKALAYSICQALGLVRCNDDKQIFALYRQIQTHLQSDHPTLMLHALNDLNKLGCQYPQDIELYQLAFKCSDSAKFSETRKLLTSLGYSYSRETKALYLAAFINYNNIKNATSTLQVLSAIGCHYSSHSEKIYLVALEDKHGYTIAALDALIKASISYTRDTLPLYLEAINQRSNAGNFPKIFSALASINCPYAKNTQELYLEAIKNSAQINDFIESFKKLFPMAGVYSKTNAPIYLKITQNNSGNCSHTIDTLISVGLRYSPDTHELYLKAFTIDFDSPSFIKACYALQATGFTFTPSTLDLYILALDSRDLFFISAMKVLRQTGIPYSLESRKLYKAALRHPLTNGYFLAACAALKKAGYAHSEATNGLYLLALQTDSATFPQLIDSLTQAGIFYSETTKKLYKTAAKNSKFSDLFPNIFKLLERINCKYTPDTEALYQAALTHAKYYDFFATYFQILSDSNCPYTNDTQELYQTVLEYPTKPELISCALSALAEIHLPYSSNAKGLYQAVLANAKHAKEFNAIFKVLRDNNCEYSEQNQALYIKAAEKIDTLPNFTAIFTLLTQYGYPYSEVTKDLYLFALNRDFKYIMEIISTLKSHGIQYSEANKAVFQTALECDVYLKNFPLLFEVLAQIGCEYSLENQSLYLTAIKYSIMIDQFPKIFAVLASIGCTFSKSTKVLYKTAMEHYGHNRNIFLQAFNTLQKLGYTYTEDTIGLYQAAIIKRNTIDNFYTICNFFKRINYEYLRDIKAATKLLLNIEKWQELFIQAEEQLENYGFSPNVHLALYRLVFNQIQSDLDIPVTLLVHNSLYTYVLTLLDPTNSASLGEFLTSLQTILTSEQRQQLIYEIFAVHTETLTQEEFLFSIIKEVGDLMQIEHGPLIKTASTKKFEDILNLIATDNKHLEARINSLGEYELFFQGQDQPITNLSLLCKYANLNHLALDERLCINLSTLFMSMLPQPLPSADKYMGTGVIAKLPEVIRLAIHIYTGDVKDDGTGIAYFKTVNAFFRGEIVRPFAFFDSLSPSEALTATVIFSIVLTSLIAYGMNQLPTSLYDDDVYREEKAILETLQASDINLNSLTSVAAYQTALSQANITMEADKSAEQYTAVQLLLDGYPLLARTEELQDENIRKRRQAGIKPLPALTSTSSYHLENEINQTKTLFDNTPAKLSHIGSISEFPEEKEVILIPGTQILTNPINEHEMRAHIVASPSYQQDEYWPDHALRTSFLKYLHQPYKDEDDSTNINGIVVQRPNHGLAHHHRVMLYIPHIIEYFSHFAQDEQFRNFCKMIDDVMLNALKIAAAFSVSGRESEKRFRDDPERYREFRQASAQNFKNYADAHAHEFLQDISLSGPELEALINTDDFKNTPENEQLQKIEQLRHQLQVAEIARLTRIILYMGSPEYAGKITEDRATHLFHIANMAHKLDLQRCFTATDYKDALLSYQTAPLIAVSAEQNAALVQLQQYATQLIEAHGDMLCCHINAGTLVDCNKAYQDHFGRLSNDPKELAQYSTGVVLPKIGRPRSIPREQPKMETESDSMTETTSPACWSDVMSELDADNTQITDNFALIPDKLPEITTVFAQNILADLTTTEDSFNQP